MFAASVRGYAVMCFYIESVEGPLCEIVTLAFSNHDGLKGLDLVHGSDWISGRGCDWHSACGRDLWR